MVIYDRFETFWSQSVRLWLLNADLSSFKFQVFLSSLIFWGNQKLLCSFGFNEQFCIWFCQVKMLARNLSCAELVPAPFFCHFVNNLPKSRNSEVGNHFQNGWKNQSKFFVILTQKEWGFSERGWSLKRMEGWSRSG